MDQKPNPWNPWNNPNPAAIRRVPYPTAKPHSCPYCQSPVELVNNAVVYNKRSFGDWPYLYICSNRQKCDAYVGLHPETDIPLGTLANKETRDARLAVKGVFNRIWQDKHMSRSEAYRFLAKRMQISDRDAKRDCHIALFDVAQCRKAQSICTDYLTKPKGRNYAKP